jgi:hypothetical protein
MGNGQNGVYYSTDHGANWSKYYYGTGFCSITTNFNNSVYYAGTCDGYFVVSYDHGSNWDFEQRLDSQFNGPINEITTNLNGSTIIATTNSRIWVSKNSGKDWSMVKTDSTTTYGWYALASDRTGRYAIASNWDSWNNNQNKSFVYYSSNFGVNWTKSDAPGTYLWSSLTSDESGRYMAASQNPGTIYFSNDYGKTWSTNKKIYKIIPKPSISNFPSVYPTPPPSLKNGKKIYINYLHRQTTFF